MNLILILPTAELPRFGEATPTDGPVRLHLVLAQECHDGNYFGYYKDRRAQGDYLILDNGADELEEGIGLAATLEVATRLRAQEVVLPDVQWDAAATLQNSLGALSYLRSPEGRAAYDRAGRPRLQVVPQGRDNVEWAKTAEKLISATRVAMHDLDGPSPVVGVAKQYDTLKGGRTWCCGVLRPHLTPAEDVHLLGWAHRLMDPFEVAAKHPWVRSIDSAKPIVYAMAGVKASIEGNTPYPLRPDDYFASTFPRTREFHSVMAHNLKAFTP